MDNCLNDDLITISDLTFSHGDRLLYDRINLTIPRGKVTAVMGPSGIGKTTLLRLIGGQLKPESGHILFDGEDIPTLSRSRLYEVRKRMSMLFQSGALFTGMTVFDNVAFPLREHSGLPEELIHTIVMMKLQAVGLRGAARATAALCTGAAPQADWALAKAWRWAGSWASQASNSTCCPGCGHCKAISQSRAWSIAGSCNTS